MDVKKVEKLIELMKKHKLHSIEFSDKTEKIAIVASNSATIVHAPSVVAQEATAKTASKPALAAGKLIKSPFVGTYYGASSPDSEPFVTIGKRVKKGDTLCIIEAMKLMNEIEADSNGIIREILAENAQPVEYDQPLFVIE